MRLFIGVFPTDEELIKIRNLVRSLDKIKRNFKFIPYDQMHLTAKFLGNNITEASRDEIIEALNGYKWTVKTRPIVKVEKVMYGFPGQNSPNVIFMNIAKNPELDKLIFEINDLMKEQELPGVVRRKDWRKLTHHITIGRTKRSVSNSLVRSTREALERVKSENVEFEVKKLYLVQSELSPTGPVYRKLAQFSLE